VLANNDWGHISKQGSSLLRFLVGWRRPKAAARLFQPETETSVTISTWPCVGIKAIAKVAMGDARLAGFGL